MDSKRGEIVEWRVMTEVEVKLMLSEFLGERLTEDYWSRSRSFWLQPRETLWLEYALKNKRLELSAAEKPEKVKAK